MSTSVSLIGGALLAVLLAGYVAQRYLPPPTPSIIGVDLGTTYSSVAVYHAGSGEVQVISDDFGRKAIPSVVAFLPNGTVLVGHEAVAQSDHNPAGTFYDAKRFIGKRFGEQEFEKEITRYPFEIILNDSLAYFVLPTKDRRLVTPEEIGSHIVKHLKRMAEKQLSVSKVHRTVLSVPAEFDDFQRNRSVTAANLAGLDVLRVINEPTAAALAYGLHKKEGVEHVLIVDLGGGTLDVSLLLIQGGMFITRAMAGNNHLGGQDFNQRMLVRLLNFVESEYGRRLLDKEDVQHLRLSVEDAKLELTNATFSEIRLEFRSLVDPATNAAPLRFAYAMSRTEFEALNADLFAQILRPVEAALLDADLTKSDVDEIVLVGGSTRIPKIRRILSHFFDKSPNYGVDPELAVVTGVAVQAGVMGGGWPLQVAATELPTKLKKIHVYRD